MSYLSIYFYCSTCTIVLCPKTMRSNKTTFSRSKVVKKIHFYRIFRKMDNFYQIHKMSLRNMDTLAFILDATRRYSMLLDATRRYLTLLDGTRRYSRLLNATQRYSTLLDATGRYWTLLDATRRYSTLLDATRRYSTLLDAARRCSTLLDAARRCSTGWIFSLVF
jgi:hypothetical protein